MLINTHRRDGPRLPWLTDALHRPPLGPAYPGAEAESSSPDPGATAGRLPLAPGAVAGPLPDHCPGAVTGYDRCVPVARRTDCRRPTPVRLSGPLPSAPGAAAGVPLPRPGAGTGLLLPDPGTVAGLPPGYPGPAGAEWPGPPGMGHPIIVLSLTGWPRGTGHLIPARWPGCRHVISRYGDQGVATPPRHDCRVARVCGRPTSARPPGCRRPIPARLLSRCHPTPVHWRGPTPVTGPGDLGHDRTIPGPKPAAGRPAGRPGAPLALCPQAQGRAAHEPWGRGRIFTPGDSTASPAAGRSHHRRFAPCGPCRPECLRGDGMVVMVVMGWDGGTWL